MLKGSQLWTLTDLNLKVRLGLLYLHVEKYAKAIGQFKEILQEVPDSDRVLYYLGLVYERTNDHKSAQTYFSRIPSDSGFFQDSNLRVARILQDMARKRDAALRKIWRGFFVLCGSGGRSSTN